MDETARAGRPLHLWIVGGLGTLWNAFGCYDYFMTRTRGADYIEGMMHTADGEAIMAYINGFPIWATAAWALGVWGGLAGSILLLMRHSMAVPTLAVSLIGAFVGIGYQLVNPSDIPELSESINKVMPYIIIAIALVLFLYARAQRAKGVLR